MKEQHNTHKLCQGVPKEVKTTDVNQLVTQNVDELLAIQVQVQPLRE